MENQNLTPETPVEGQVVVAPETPVEAQTPTTDTITAQQVPQQPNVEPQPAMQPNMYASQGMYANPAVPPQTPKKKANGVVIGLVIAIVVLVMALGGLVAFAAYNMFANSPEARLAKGFAKWTEEDKKTVSSVSETLGWAEINNSMLHGATSKDLSLNMTFPSLELPTIGIDMVDTCDYPNQKDFSDWKVSVSNIELLNFQIALDSEKLYLGIPTLLADTYFAETENFAQNFNNSTWAEMLGLTLDESFVLDTWAQEEEKTEAEEVDESILFSEEFMEDFEAKLKEMAENIIIEETETVIEVSRNGKTVKCDGIYVVAPKDDLNDIMDMMQEELRDGKYGQEIIAKLSESGVVDVEDTWNQIVDLLNVRFTDDFQLMFYLDNKNNIVHMATPEVIVMDNGVAVGLALDFVGDQNPNDVVEGFLKVVENNAGVTLSYDFVLENEEKDTTATTDFDVKMVIEEVGYDTTEGTLDFTYKWDSEKCEFEMEVSMESEGEQLLSFGMEGNFADVVKKESFVMDLGSLKLSIEGEDLMKVTGQFEVKPLAEEVKIPSESKDFFGMTEMDIQSMLFEIIGNAEKMTEALEEFSF